MCQLSKGNVTRIHVPEDKPLLAFRWFTMEIREGDRRYKPLFSPYYPHEGWKRREVLKAQRPSRTYGSSRKYGFHAFKTAQGALSQDRANETRIMVPVHVWGRVYVHRTGGGKYTRLIGKPGYRAQYMKILV